MHSDHLQIFYSIWNRSIFHPSTFKRLDLQRCEKSPTKNCYLLHRFSFLCINYYFKKKQITKKVCCIDRSQMKTFNNLTWKSNLITFLNNWWNASVWVFYDYSNQCFEAEQYRSLKWRMISLLAVFLHVWCKTLQKLHKNDYFIL